ncbi:CUB and sushi domain-containing protein 3 [Triplophysa tibetana]|uniref:CUB and sushi domain-containing protein 3 n=1 Tax=Triplophysa tibetana TaxID=1572043 RepID=A0A5A9NMY7_9TELE|nr:CUB and sushi domain-containing protein 3 [Triplophysa tibetana]
MSSQRYGEKNLFLRLTGFQIPPPVTSTGSVFSLRLTSDFAVSAHGFKIYYEGKPGSQRGSQQFCFDTCKYTPEAIVLMRAGTVAVTAVLYMSQCVSTAALQTKAGIIPEEPRLQVPFSAEPQLKFSKMKLQSSSCGNPGVPPKGIIYGTRFNVGDKIRYSCVTGYVLDGHPQLSCVTNAGNAAVWDFPVPICRGKQQSDSSPCDVHDQYIATVRACLLVARLLA